jgi:hypothetical protein
VSRRDRSHDGQTDAGATPVARSRHRHEEEIDVQQPRRNRRRAMTVSLIPIVALVLTASAAGARTPPVPSADELSNTVDNPYFPLRPGERWVYEGQTADGLERTLVVVTGETKRVMGVDAVVVHDTVSLEGQVIEDTYDWFAQDEAGNVWYLGEDTHEYKDGVPINAKGAWEAGVGGAKPGIVMPAHPRVGDRYRQEFLRGVAEDKAEVLSVRASARVPAGSYHDVVKTKDRNPLEPDVVEHKLYAEDVGLVLEVTLSSGGERVELIAHTTP